MSDPFNVVMLVIAGIGLAIGILAFVSDRLERRAKK
jgi:hypothetical protein